MPVSKEITNLVINKVESQDVYNYMSENNLINEDELYLVEGLEKFSAKTVIETNNSLEVGFWVGTQEEYNAIEEKSDIILYFIKC